MLLNKKILITGAMGKSGAMAAELYARLGAEVHLSDRSTGELPESLRALPESLRSHPIKDHRPREDAGLIEEIHPDFVVTAPGVPLSGEIFVEAKKRGIPVYGENDFAFHLIQESPDWKEKPFWIGVTGTDGKSTTTALIAHLIQEATEWTAVPCGNYGTPVSSLVLSPVEKRVHVVECSSFQLEPTAYFHPHVSLILNVAEDHLDRYPDMESYLHAKLRILELQSGEDLFLAPREIAAAADRFEAALGKSSPVRKVAVPLAPFDGETIPFRGEVLLSKKEFPLVGDHNQINLRFALETLDEFARRNSIRLDPAAVARAIRSFRGLPHRMEDLGTKCGIRFINDSKSTTVQAIQSAMRSLRGVRVFLLLGGREKGADFSILREFLGHTGVVFIPFGEAGHHIAKATGLSVESTRKNLEEAFRTALDLAERRSDAAAAHTGRIDTSSAGDTVILLSPGCSSYDQYRSYTERGDHFRRLVEEWRC